MNWYNFTQRVRKVLAMSREEASRLRHSYVGTEHILLGLIREGEGVAAAVLSNLGIDPDAVRLRVEAVAEKRPDVPNSEPDIPYTSRAKKVLELAMDEAKKQSHSYVGTEHLLLGLLREEKGIAARVLREFGAELEPVRQETLRMLRAARPNQDPPAHGGVSRGTSGAGHRPIGFKVQVEFKHGVRWSAHFERAADAILYLRALDADAPGPTDPPPPDAAT